MSDLFERARELSPAKLALFALRINKLASSSQPRQSAPGAKRLVAYVIPKDGETLQPRELRNFLAKKLPDYMVPAAYVFLEELPLTSSGKLDRRALPAPDQHNSEQEADFVAPRNVIEEVLSDIWSEVLSLERISVNSNFFELGGHSLAAAQVVYRVRDLFHIEVPVRSLFEGPTLAELAQALVAKEPKPGRTEKIAKAFKMIKGMSPEQMKQALEEKKKAKSS